MEQCLFCRIVEGKIPAEIVHRDEKVVAFKDINPQAPVHLLVIPVKHTESLMTAGAEDAVSIIAVFAAIKDLAVKHGLEEGFRVVTNCGENGGQTVGHLHFHILGRRVMSWPPG